MYFISFTDRYHSFDLLISPNELMPVTPKATQEVTIVRQTMRNQTKSNSAALPHMITG